MTLGTRRDAEHAFRVLASHLSGKRIELMLAIVHGRGIEQWFQHEAIVALDNAYVADLSGRQAGFWREGLRNEGSESFDPESRRRPFDLVFEEPQMVASIKMYLPWKDENAAVADVRRDLIELRDDSYHGFLIAGRLDFEDGLGYRGGVRKGKSGCAWLESVVQRAKSAPGEEKQDLRLSCLVESAVNKSAECLKMELPRLRLQPDEEYRTPILAFGAWSVLRQRK